MAAQITEPKAGEKTVQLWRIVAELVKQVNALSNIQLSPQGIGKVEYSDGNIMIVFNTEKCA